MTSELTPAQVAAIRESQRQTNEWALKQSAREGVAAAALDYVGVREAPELGRIRRGESRVSA